MADIVALVVRHGLLLAFQTGLFLAGMETGLLTILKLVSQSMDTPDKYC